MEALVYTFLTISTLGIFFLLSFFENQIKRFFIISIEI